MQKIALTFIYLILLFSQNFLKIDRISVDDGLSSSIINDITQSDDGFMWIATDDGLNKFDGYSFKIFRKNEFKELSNNQIKSIQFDDQRQLWIGTRRGLSVYDLNNKSFRSIDRVENNEISNVTDIVYNKQTSTIWVASRNGLLKCDTRNNTFTFYKKNGINKLYLDESNTLWIAHSAGLSFYNESTDKIKSTSVKQSITGVSQDITGDLWLTTLNDVIIYSPNTQKQYDRLNRREFFSSFPKNITGEIFSDSQHRLWLSTLTDGLFSYNYETNTFNQFKNDVWNKNSISHNHITKVFEDNSGLFWIGTKGGGLNKIRYYKTNHFSHTYSHPSKKNSLSSNNVTSILHKRNNVWYGLGLDGIDIYSKENGSYTHINVPHHVNTIFESDKNVYFGTSSGLVEIDEKGITQSTFLNTIRINSGYEAVDGSSYIGTSQGLFKKNASSFEKVNLAGVDEVVTITQCERKNLWLGTRNGLVEYNPSTKESIIHVSDEQNTNSLSDNEIISLYIDSEKTLWVGTSSGLNYIKNSKIYRVQDELRNSFINAILEDKNKNIWFSTNYGLVRYDQVKKKYVTYLEVDGIQGNQFNVNSVSQDKSGKMFFGGINGVTSFLPDNIYFNSTTSVPVFSEILVNYKSILKDKNQSDVTELNLQHYENSIVFQIASLNYSIPKKNKYQYKLEGFDSDWVQSGTQRQITYTNLDPGEYILRVRSSNNDGVWSREDRVLPIVIVSPYWETMWFRAIVIAFILIVSFSYYKVRTNRYKRQQSFLENEVEKRTYELIVKNHEVEEINESLGKENDIRKETEEKLLRSLQETEAIFQNVSEGIFLLGSDYKINEQHSLELERMFHKKTLANRDFVELMKPLVTDKIYGAIKNFINLLYTEDIDEDVVLELNPINEVEAHFEIKPGEYETRTLRFQFKRILSENNIVNLLVTVMDVSETLKLQQQLKDKDAKNKEEIEQLLSILKVDSTSLSSFLIKSTNLFISIKKKFKEDHDNYGELLKEIYRDIHNLKGNANLLDIKFLVERFHRLEDVIRDKMTIESSILSGNDFLSILFEIGELQNVLDNMNQLLGRVVTLSKTLVIQSDEDEMNLLLKNIDNKISILSKELGKKARFECDETNINKIPSIYKDSVKDILLQLVHNSLVHGIENVKERERKKKNKEALLKLSVEEGDDKLTIRFRDDGIGLDLDKIKRLSVKRGKYTEEEVNKLPQKKLVPLIFEDGFSTEEKTSQIAGRGEGMSLVKQIVSKFKGKIKVAFAKDKYFEVKIHIPLV